MIATILDRYPTPHCALLLGLDILDADAARGWVRVGFVAKPDFCNASGTIQGGFLTAMLDDTMGPALAATLAKGEFAPTINLNVSFEKAARVGTIIQGKGRVLKRGKEICFLVGELYQNDQLVASATATAIIRRSPG